MCHTPFSCDFGGDTEQLVIVVLGWQDSLDGHILGVWMDMRQVTLAGALLSFVLTFLAILLFYALTFCTVGGGMCSSSRSKLLSIR